MIVFVFWLVESIIYIFLKFLNHLLSKGKPIVDLFHKFMQDTDNFAYIISRCSFAHMQMIAAAFLEVFNYIPACISLFTFPKTIYPTLIPLRYLAMEGTTTAISIGWVYYAIIPSCKFI